MMDTKEILEEVSFALSQCNLPGLKRLRDWVEAGKPVLLGGEILDLPRISGGLETRY